MLILTARFIILVPEARFLCILPLSMVFAKFEFIESTPRR
jgi:hypothetical protein